MERLAIDPPLNAETANAWGAYPDVGFVHVVPLHDRRRHSLSEACWCGPVFDGTALLHSSADGREDFEHGRKLS